VRPRRIDAFPFAGSPTELLLLECRLTELYDAVDAFVIVEATTDHQGHAKPLNFYDHYDRFAPWKDKIVYIVADDLPTPADDEWEWAREHAQREWIGRALIILGAQPDDILMQSDADEIPTALAARNVNPRGDEKIPFHQRGHFWAIDWLYPPGWNGTVACRVGALPSFTRDRAGCFAAMRDSRNNPSPKQILAGGWHFSWLGTHEDRMAKVRSFCHPEVEHRIVTNADRYYRDGVHVDDIKLEPVDVDHTWPKWMQDPANVPECWLRPR
jgi:hypothetical protein